MNGGEIPPFARIIKAVAYNKSVGNGKPLVGNIHMNFPPFLLVEKGAYPYASRLPLMHQLDKI